VRLRIGFIGGFALGYYLGAMAGRERYEQLNRILRDARGSTAIEGAADKAKAVVDLGKERARDVVGAKTGNGANAKDPEQQSTETPI
jgi:hypothetical protein